MEGKLKTLFDYQKFESNSALQSVIDSVHARYAVKELSLDEMEQRRIVLEVLDTMRRAEGVRNLLRGFMIESYLVDGRQDIGGGVYGQSITDACLGWEKTERLLLEMAELV